MINCVQWPYNGEMSWSVRRDKADTLLSADAQRRITTECHSKDMGAEIATDEWVEVTFEGVSVKARKVVHRVTDMAQVLRDTGGGGTESLTIYYVVAPVRGHWVSCIMSHWNNDNIDPQSGLPPLIAKVMKL